MSSEDTIDCFDHADLQLRSPPEHRIDPLSFAHSPHTLHPRQIFHKLRVLWILLLHRKFVRNAPAIKRQEIRIDSRERIPHCMHVLELFLNDGITPLNLSTALLTYLVVYGLVVDEIMWTKKGEVALRMQISGKKVEPFVRAHDINIRASKELLVGN